mgnify:CR=1 FL=1|jgi:hypothetical protein
MTRIVGRLIADNEINGQKILLENNDSLRAKNFANDGEVPILLVDGEDKTQLQGMVEYQEVVSPANPKQIVNVEFLYNNAIPIASYQNDASGFSTTSVTDVEVPGTESTPAAGKYVILVNASVGVTVNNESILMGICKDGVVIPSSSRLASASGGGWYGALSTMSIVEVDGTNVIEVCIRSSNASSIVSIDQVTILLMYLAPL